MIRLLRRSTQAAGLAALCLAGLGATGARAEVESVTPAKPSTSTQPAGAGIRTVYIAPMSAEMYEFIIDIDPVTTDTPES